ncbi:DGQHR domain-containing protein [Methylobacillus sp. Pita1]|uniref:DGQHR domain-containing protein n=1 Tax=Methylobacillus sp. Pita1 TaxID=3382642 RepID=UPI0038B4FA13
MNTKNHIRRPALRINQPLGSFFVFSLDAETLNRITYSQRSEVKAKLSNENSDSDKGYDITGSQRKESSSRLEELAQFILATDATFPNSIILAANYDEDGNIITRENNTPPDARLWMYEDTPCGPEIIIPLHGRTASIIDGQHRLHAFTKLAEDSPRREMELLCVVFLELPPPFQAYVFATINFNQKKVDRSLAYELFGFSANPKESNYWPPETLAVYFARILNTEPSSPLYKCISLAAHSTDLFPSDGSSSPIKVSMATVIDGILSLISKKPKEDRYKIKSIEHTKSDRSSLQEIQDLPLRSYFIQNNDRAIYDVIFNFFTAYRIVVLDKAHSDSYLLKTVGIQAAFDLLKKITATLPINADNYNIESLVKFLSPCSTIAKKDNRYQASGIGRSEIRRELFTVLNLS